MVNLRMSVQMSPKMSLRLPSMMSSAAMLVRWTPRSLMNWRALVTF